MGRKVIENDAYAFVDLSHYIFHRYYAIQRWLLISEKGDLTQDELVSMFEKRFEDELIKIKKKLGFAWKNCYLVKDCSRQDIWRMPIFPEYKKNRTDKSHEKFDPIVFSASYSDIIPRLMTKYGFGMLGFDHAEADDVIGVIHSYIRKHESTKNKKIYIITNDNDYLQLLDECTVIMNCGFKELKERFVKTPETLQVFGLWKSIRGDDSDCIPSIGSKIGDKTALKLALDEKALADKLRSGGDAMRQALDRNKRLVMFENIPFDIRTGIESLWDGVST